VSSVIDKINNLGIGVTATLSTASAAGASGTGTDTGIEISGNITSSAGQTKAGDTTITATTFYDTGSGQTSNVAGTVDSATGIAKITYTAGTGTNLKELGDLDSTSAQSILTALNSAITDVAAQDGYIGAQINTLDSINQVMSTQQENIESAQNAIQATDYASATSDMSKYEVLTQTGIAALAQANSVQQEVTKLLQ
jgi:flagellin